MAIQKAKQVAVWLGEFGKFIHHKPCWVVTQPPAQPPIQFALVIVHQPEEVAQATKELRAIEVLLERKL